MSDFGANIFDDEPPKRSEPPPPKNPPAAAPPSSAPRAPATPANAPQQQARPAPPGPPREGRREPAPPRAPEPNRGPEGGPSDGPGRGPERHTAFRPSASPAPTAPPAADRPGQGSERVPPRPGRTDAPPRQPQRAGVAVLVDLDALQAEARAQRGELAMQRLRNGLGGDRTVQRAVAFAATNVTPPNGFELQVASAGPGLGDGVRFAATALELLAAAGALVLAPASASNRQLAKALRAAGHAVALAGFDAAAASGERMRVLGRDCLFVP